MENQERVKESFKKWYAPYRGLPVDILDTFKAGYNACLDQEEWKNLYSEGLEVGMEMLRNYKEQVNKTK